MGLWMALAASLTSPQTPDDRDRNKRAATPTDRQFFHKRKRTSVATGHRLLIVVIIVLIGVLHTRRDSRI